MNADVTLRSAKAVLAVDLRGVPLTRTNQFVVGWMRATFQQSIVISELTKAGMAHAAAPNRRAFWELALRLLWLADMPQPDREQAVDTMLAHGVATEVTTDKHMKEMGLESSIDVAAMQHFALDASTDKQAKEQAKNLTDAVRATGMNSAVIYRLWRSDSTWAHATGFLAGQYAPASRDDTIDTGNPPVLDENLDLHRLVAMLVVFTVGFLLRDEGVPSDLAGAPAAAFVAVP
ncbi:hypothetical protein [uncultured Arthrobacter sp.]|uniref:hypothetical protein n=1 Tax=uncultured Arthrobacter sp. TaxID=114050 RepID=UPI00263451BF|nr:hypothetical protein [uncultured Arthrobacter sp.]